MRKFSFCPIDLTTWRGVLLQPQLYFCIERFGGMNWRTVTEHTFIQWLINTVHIGGTMTCVIVMYCSKQGYTSSIVKIKFKYCIFKNWKILWIFVLISIQHLWDIFQFLPAFLSNEEIQLMPNWPHGSTWRVALASIVFLYWRIWRDELTKHDGTHFCLVIGEPLLSYLDCNNGYCQNLINK